MEMSLNLDFLFGKISEEKRRRDSLLFISLRDLETLLLEVLPVGPPSSSPRLRGSLLT